MKAVWKRIHAWLDENAPAGYGHLRPGADAKAILAAEAAMGLKLPDDVKASYRTHDGQEKEPGLIGGEGWYLLSLKELVEQWQRGSESDPKDTRRVPVAWGRAGDCVFLNLGPDAGETARLMIRRRDRTEPDHLAPSFSAWLADFADQLARGEFAYSEEHGEVVYADDIDSD